MTPVIQQLIFNSFLFRRGDILLLDVVAHQVDVPFHHLLLSLVNRVDDSFLKNSKANFEVFHFSFNLPQNGCLKFRGFVKIKIKPEPSKEAANAGWFLVLGRQLPLDNGE